ncbi:MAG: hypothetical protein Fur0041_16070 [Bacteroidia bacterium]
MRVYNTLEPPPPSYPEINIFPNPSIDGNFVLQYEFDSEGDLEIYNALGQIIFKTNLESGAIQKTINLSTKANGVYYYRLLENGNELKTRKLVISK